MSTKLGRGFTLMVVGAVTLALLGAGLFSPGPAAGSDGEATTSDVRKTKREDRPPRKVIVGTAVQRFWGDYPGLEARLAQLEGIVGEMAAAAQRKYGRGLDLAALPEMAVTGGRKGPAAERSLPFAGQVQDAFVAMARKYKCHIVVPLELLEHAPRNLCYNACLVLDRNGETLGTYRKLHPAVQFGTENMEDGMSVGRDVPVFECDFGRLGLQICFDMEFDFGWEELARQGAELVVWPTQSPQTVHPACRALRYQYYIVSSTWRNNASLFEPTGKTVAQVKPPERVLVQEIDLSFMVLPWAPQLKNGEGLREKYGDKVGFRYYEDEDCGLFWSNDPGIPIGEMAKSIGLTDWSEEHARLEEVFARVRASGKR
jgi:predicted amidohydrolase